MVINYYQLKAFKQNFIFNLQKQKGFIEGKKA